MPINNNFNQRNQHFSRNLYLTILRNALSLNEFRFARQAALNWLATYPGDLPIRLLHASALCSEKRFDLAIPILEELCQADPEYIEAWELHWQVYDKKVDQIINKNDPQINVGSEKQIELLGCLITLGSGNKVGQAILDSDKGISWIQLLLQARVMLREAHSFNQIDIGYPEEIEHILLRVLAEKPNLPLVAISHLDVIRMKVLAGSLPAQALRALAEHYHVRFSSTLQIHLILAETLMDGGEHEKAVAILHESTSADIIGQVAIRIWGKNHPYQRLWPARLEARLDIPIPASVAASMGWNQLTTGIIPENPQRARQEVKEQKATSIINETQPTNEKSPKEYEQPSDLEAYDKQLDDIKVENIAEKILLPEIALDESTTSKNLSPGEFGTNSSQNRVSIPQYLQPVQKEFERISKRLNRIDLAHADGRFPVYVVMTTHQGMLRYYGEESTSIIEKEIIKLVQAVQSNPKWHALLYYADDGITLPNLPIINLKRNVKSTDPNALKLSLVDLDSALKHRGEMIGAILIVGGPAVVPYHHLPNPVEDDDVDVPSDNPYGTRDDNYFIPEWPVGRIPGGDGNAPRDVGLLIKTLQEISTWHSTSVETDERPPWYMTWLQSIFKRLLIRNGRNGGNNSMGYSFGLTTAAWRFASFAVFKSIGDPKKMKISPPLPLGHMIKENLHEEKRYQRRGFKERLMVHRVESSTVEDTTIQIPPVKLAYFNLHGTIDAVEWFGQIDPTEPGFDNADQFPYYPVALKPRDIGVHGIRAPLVVYTEACYGAHIDGKSLEQAMAYRFLQSGTQAFIGSTCTSYGSIGTPLIAADYLGYAFWKSTQQGLPAGESLRRAKIALAHQMHLRQGYLDGEDQKTLISFILFGDPLIQPFIKKHQLKTIQRSLFPPTPIQTICDHSLIDINTKDLSQDTIQSVKKAVQKYLPGMVGATMTLRDNKVQCDNNCMNCCNSKPTSNNGKKQSLAKSNHKLTRLVILSKEDPNNIHNHPHYARLRLDEKGCVVKITVSR